MVYKSLTFEQLQNLVYIGTLSSRWLTDFRVQMTSMVFFRYLHAYEHFELGAEGFTQKSCNCPHPIITEKPTWFSPSSPSRRALI